MEDELKDVSPGFNADALAAFWQIARESVGWTSLQPILGPNRSSSLFPPYVKLSEDAATATRIAEAFADGTQTQLRTPLADFEEADLPLPAEGDLMIICDGNGIPRCLVFTRDVRVEGAEVVEDFASLYPKFSDVGGAVPAQEEGQK